MGVSSPQVEVYWALPQLLDELGVTAYQLANQVARKSMSLSRHPTIYRLARESTDAKRVDLQVITSILNAFRELGKDVAVTDLLRERELSEAEASREEVKEPVS